MWGVNHMKRPDSDFRTPDEFFGGMVATYGPFDLDSASSDENARCDRHWTREDDGLKQDWRCGECGWDFWDA